MRRRMWTKESEISDLKFGPHPGPPPEYRGRGQHSRRQFLRSTCAGFGMVGLAGLIGSIAPRAAAAANLLAPRPHFAPRAKRIIFLFMNGGPSHVDTFDRSEERR